MAYVSDSSSMQLACFSVILLLQCKAIHSSGVFQVLGPGHTLYAVTGEDLLLPCSLKPSMSAEGMTVEWFKLNQKQESLVHLYKDGRDQNDKQIQSYKDRTSLFKADLQKGNASLKLSNIQVSDEGDYKCLIESGARYDDAQIQVKVRGIGQPPLMSLEDYKRDGIYLVCESGGWMPEPVLDWLDNEGRSLTVEPAEVHRDSAGFRVKRQLIIRNNDSKSYICRVSQKDERWATEKEVEKEAMLYISSEWFIPLQPLEVPSATARIIIICSAPALTLIGGLLLFVLYKRVTPEELCIFQHNGTHLALFKTSYNTPSRHSEKLDVRLDPDTGHPLLVLSSNGGSEEVRSVQAPQDLLDNPERFDEYPCVLSRNILGYDETAGGLCHYDVRVEGKTEWTLGLMNASVDCKGQVSVCSEENFIIWLEDGHYWTNTTPQIELVLSEKPETLRVFVDFLWDQVSFHNVATGSLICLLKGLKFGKNFYRLMFVPGTFSEENANPLTVNPE